MSTVDEQLPPPPQPPQPHRISTCCDLHPDEHFTGFCPSCLCERLSVLDNSSAANASTTVAAGRKSASSGLKSIFRSSTAANGNSVGERNTLRTKELRRSQSFSVGKNDAGLGFGGVFEPQRKSCDVRGRNTLWSLFSQDDGKRAAAAANCALNAASSSSRAGIGTGNDRVEGEISSCNGFVIELKEERDCDAVFEEVEDQEAEIEVIEEPIASINSISNPKFSSEEHWEFMEAEKLNLKQMKNNADLDSQAKKAGGGNRFWSAASVFSKKLKAWTRKNSKLKKRSGGRTVQVDKKSNGGRNYRETQSEIADYGNGRRSCDIDPRFSVDAGRMSLDYGRISLDAGRMSFDDPRYSFDEPRASWDGYLIGGGRLNNLSRMGVAPMVSVMEDRPSNLMALRKDNLIPLEEPRRSIHEEEGVPGGAAETKDYYLDSSSSRRRKSLDRSSSARRISAAVVAEMDEMKKSGPCNAKVTPATVDTGSAKGTSLREDCSESFGMGFRDSTSVIGSSSDRKVVKKSRSWRSWNIWGLISRRGSNKDEDDDRCDRENGGRRSYSESWQERGRDGLGVNPRDGFSSNVFRSNSSVSWRSSHSHSLSGTSGGTVRKSIVETNGHVKKMSSGFVLERNRSARYSPNHADNGQLRLYTTPMRGSQRGPTVKANEAAYSHTVAGTGGMLY